MSLNRKVGHDKAKDYIEDSKDKAIIFFVTLYVHVSPPQKPPWSFVIRFYFIIDINVIWIRTKSTSLCYRTLINFFLMGRVNLPDAQGRQGAKVWSYLAITRFKAHPKDRQQSCKRTDIKIASAGLRTPNQQFYTTQSRLNVSLILYYSDSSFYFHVPVFRSWSSDNGMPLDTSF